ncbi:adenylate/guanylate cyclase domain-containing protein [Nordella sp. HKS 07]|uniref:adenylate/guanylate cyclase domain-containing protein n=1 Tax=Nordella sp. HKS 07 TaxID=2712222 RepID=UPI0013E14DCD|nr:adenylate/guanylate cyclase domain-containing protein [Nordella sp. HKS 07]QIG49006.1 adenylate/guanylate cyclase domain-containing protein [Nordella sp. HKS 07]
MTRQERKLAAILAADVAGYSRLMAADEAGTLVRLNGLRADLINPKIAQYQGRVVGSAGDSLLIEFGSAVDAVQCAVETQEWIALRNTEWPDHNRMVFRIGINLGDVISDGGTIYGDAVNLAARLEKLAAPGTVVVGRSIYDQVKSKLPYAFVDLGEQLFKNIAEPVRAFEVAPAEQLNTPLPTSDNLPLPAKPSVAVLPFNNMSSDPEQEYFSDGITEDIIAELSRNPSLFVIARNSSFVFKGRAVDIAEVGRKLGVRYVVEGSVRRAGKRIRITAQLIEASSGNHVWAERYDRDLDDLFAVQDEVTDQIVWALAGRVGAAEIDRSKREKRGRLDAYDTLLRGIEAFHRFSEKDNANAIQHFESAIELDPTSARAYAWLAEANGYASVFAADASRRVLSLQAAQRSIELGEASGHAEAIIASNCRWNGDFEAAEAHLNRAIVLGPRNPYVLAWMGYFRLWQGRTVEARDIGERLRRLDPLDPGWVHELLACAYYLLSDYAASLESFRRWRNNEHYRGLANLTACLGKLGRIDDAIVAWRKCIAARPGFTIEEYKMGSPYLRKEDLEHWLDGLNRAGILE